MIEASGDLEGSPSNIKFVLVSFLCSLGNTISVECPLNGYAAAVEGDIAADCLNDSCLRGRACCESICVADAS